MPRTLFALLAVLLPAGFRPADAACPCAAKEEVELAIILDCSGSMNHTLATLQEHAKRAAEALEGVVRLRVAVVIYRTKEHPGPRTRVLPFTSNRAKLAEFLAATKAEGGGEEEIAEGLTAALEQLAWTKGARKTAVLMGDEQPTKPEHFDRCLAAAAALKDRGIVLHAVTASDTAWMYWAPGNMSSWKQMVADMGEEARKVFRLPDFDELARRGGGVSVSAWNSRELLLWLLAFATGMNQAEARRKLDVNRFLEWSKQRDLQEAAQRRGLEAGAPPSDPRPPLIAWLRHGGEWEVPHDFEALLGHLSSGLKLAGPAKVQVLELEDPALRSYPLLYVTGHGPLKWSAAERAALSAHLRAGGTLVGEACCGDPEFRLSFWALCRELFPDRKLERLPPDHALFSCGHRLPKVRRSATARTGRLEQVEPEIYGLTLVEVSPPGAGADAPRLRTAILYSPHDLGCMWQERPLGPVCQHEHADALKLSANLFLWALTH